MSAGDHHDDHDDHHDDHHDDDDDHDHDHAVGHEQLHDHAHERGSWWRTVLRFFGVGHGHDHGPALDPTDEADRRGWRTLWISLVGLAITAALQLVVVAISGSVALLADTIHNLSDAFTAIPLALSFWLARRTPTRRFTYGYGRTEDLAGVVIVVAILASAVLAAWSAIDRLVDPRPIDDVGWVAAAGVVGFIGNELVAVYRIRTGRRIGSAALVADGLHARTDGLTSLAVVAGAIGVAAGWERADPVAGLVISAAIVGVLVQATRQVLHRLLDGVDEGVIQQIEGIAAATPGVVGVQGVRARWTGHDLRTELEVAVDPSVSVRDADAVVEEVRHRLVHEVPRLAAAIVRVRPAGAAALDGHPDLQ